ncbi:VOC family protein [Catenuloplanes japonicus]|uniref:VOC family protein n=1 Tax=Catenuloplanes japonicus TaxID=33876 RepID=UPI0005265A25|nr:VOC family protein [Catenuloplanes japonicus]
MANGTRPIAPIRKVSAAVLGTIAVFIMLFGAGMQSWPIAALGIALLVLAISLLVTNVMRRGPRALVQGTARVDSISERPPSTLTYGRAEMRVWIDAPGLPAADVRIRDPRVPVDKWPDPGAVLPVLVAMDDMRYARIQWDEVLTHAEAAAGMGEGPAGFLGQHDDDVDEMLREAEQTPWDRRAEDNPGGTPLYTDEPYGTDPYGAESYPPEPPSGGGSSPAGADIPHVRTPEDDHPIVIRETRGGGIVLEGSFVAKDDPSVTQLPHRARRPRPHRTDAAGGYPTGTAVADPPGSAWSTAPGYQDDDDEDDEPELISDLDRPANEDYSPRRTERDPGMGSAYSPRGSTAPSTAAGYSPRGTGDPVDLGEGYSPRTVRPTSRDDDTEPGRDGYSPRETRTEGRSAARPRSTDDDAEDDTGTPSPSAARDRRTEEDVASAHSPSPFVDDEAYADYDDVDLFADSDRETTADAGGTAASRSRNRRDQEGGEHEAEESVDDRPSARDRFAPAGNEDEPLSGRDRYVAAPSSAAAGDESEDSRPAYARWAVPGPAVSAPGASAGPVPDVGYERDSADDDDDLYEEPPWVTGQDRDRRADEATAPESGRGPEDGGRGPAQGASGAGGGDRQAEERAGAEAGRDQAAGDRRVPGQGPTPATGRDRDEGDDGRSEFSAMASGGELNEGPVGDTGGRPAGGAGGRPAGGPAGSGRGSSGGPLKGLVAGVKGIFGRLAGPPEQSGEDGPAARKLATAPRPVARPSGDADVSLGERPRAPRPRPATGDRQVAPRPGDDRPAPGGRSSSDLDDLDFPIDDEPASGAVSETTSGTASAAMPASGATGAAGVAPADAPADAGSRTRAGSTGAGSADTPTGTGPSADAGSATTATGASTEMPAGAGSQPGGESTAAATDGASTGTGSRAGVGSAAETGVASGAASTSADAARKTESPPGKAEARATTPGASVDDDIDLPLHDDLDLPLDDGPQPASSGPVVPDGRTASTLDPLPLIAPTDTEPDTPGPDDHVSPAPGTAGGVASSTGVAPRRGAGESGHAPSETGRTTGEPGRAAKGAGAATTGTDATANGLGSAPLIGGEPGRTASASGPAPAGSTGSTGVTDEATSTPGSGRTPDGPVGGTGPATATHTDGGAAERAGMPGSDAQPADRGRGPDLSTDDTVVGGAATRDIRDAETGGVTPGEELPRRSRTTWASTPLPADAPGALPRRIVSSRNADRPSSDTSAGNRGAAASDATGTGSTADTPRPADVPDVLPRRIVSGRNTDRPSGSAAGNRGATSPGTADTGSATGRTASPSTTGRGNATGDTADLTGRTTDAGGTTGTGSASRATDVGGTADAGGTTTGAGGSTGSAWTAGAAATDAASGPAGSAGSRRPAESAWSTPPGAVRRHPPSPAAGTGRTISASPNPYDLTAPDSAPEDPGSAGAGGTGSPSARFVAPVTADPATATAPPTAHPGRPTAPPEPTTTAEPITVGRPSDADLAATGPHPTATSEPGTRHRSAPTPDQTTGHRPTASPETTDPRAAWSQSTGSQPTVQRSGTPEAGVAPAAQPGTTPPNPRLQRPAGNKIGPPRLPKRQTTIEMTLISPHSLPMRPLEPETPPSAGTDRPVSPAPSDTEDRVTAGTTEDLDWRRPATPAVSAPETAPAAGPSSRPATDDDWRRPTDPGTTRTGETPQSGQGSASRPVRETSDVDGLRTDRTDTPASARGPADPEFRAAGNTGFADPGPSRTATTPASGTTDTATPAAGTTTAAAGATPAHTTGTPTTGTSTARTSATGTPTTDDETADTSTGGTPHRTPEDTGRSVSTDPAAPVTTAGGSTAASGDEADKPTAADTAPHEDGSNDGLGTVLGARVVPGSWSAGDTPPAALLTPPVITGPGDSPSAEAPSAPTAEAPADASATGASPGAPTTAAPADAPASATGESGSGTVTTGAHAAPRPLELGGGDGARVSGIGTVGWRDVDPATAPDRPLSRGAHRSEEVRARSRFADEPEAGAVDDLITAYPSARPGAAGGIHGVGITILVTELDRSSEFYRDMLGFHEIDRGERNVFLASGDTRLVLRTVSETLPVNVRTVHLNLEVSDVQAVYDALRRKGVSFVHEPRAVNRGEKLELWAAAFSDPDGNGITVSQWRSAPPV